METQRCYNCKHGFNYTHVEPPANRHSHTFCRLHMAEYQPEFHCEKWEGVQDPVPKDQTYPRLNDGLTRYKKYATFAHFTRDCAYRVTKSAYRICCTATSIQDVKCAPHACALLQQALEANLFTKAAIQDMRKEHTEYVRQLYGTDTV